MERVILGNQKRNVPELAEYVYRAKFGLSNAEMMSEPIDKFNTNLMIMELENEKNERENRKIEQKSKHTKSVGRSYNY